MRVLLTLGLIVVVLAGCAPPPRSGNEGANNEVGGPGIASIATEGTITEVPPTAPPDSTAPLPVMTVAAPPIVLTPVQGHPASRTPVPPAGWKTYTDPALGVALDVPADWTEAKQSGGATFTSPLGAEIALHGSQAVGDSNEMRIGNQHCTSRTNAHDLTADICVDTASFIFTARFTLPAADGSARWLTLSTTSRSAGDVLETMFDSLHLL